MPFDQLLTDAGHGSGPNHRHRREAIGADSAIPAKERRQARIGASAPLSSEMVRRPAGPGVEADRSAHRR